MKIAKLLVIEHEDHIRAALDEILPTIPCKYEMATCLAEARQAMAQDSHNLILMGDELPARPGGTPRMQNPENFLEEMRARGGMPSVIMMPQRRPDVDDEDKLRWAGDMRARGVSTFLCKPFRTAGRTPDRVIKKLIAGQLEPVRFVAIPVLPANEREEGHRTSNVIPFGPLPVGSKRPEAAVESKAEPPPPAPAVASSVHQGAWSSIPNEPIEIEDFIAKFCEPRSKEIRKCRKRALLAAARHETVTLPLRAEQRKHGQSNTYFTHDLLAAWQGFLDEGVDLPPLASKCVIA
jgi:CheY-like chemotaxis protein